MCCESKVDHGVLEWVDSWEMLACDVSADDFLVCTNQVAAEKGLFAMEAVWTRFIPAMEAVQERIVSGEIGNLISIDTDFGFDGADAPSRLMDPKLGGGSLFDLVTYSLHLPSLLSRELAQVAPAIVYTDCQMTHMVDQEYRALLVYKTQVTESLLTLQHQLVHYSCSFDNAG